MAAASGASGGLWAGKLERMERKAAALLGTRSPGTWQDRWLVITTSAPPWETFTDMTDDPVSPAGPVWRTSAPSRLLRSLSLCVFIPPFDPISITCPVALTMSPLLTHISARNEVGTRHTPSPLSHTAHPLVPTHTGQIPSHTHAEGKPTLRQLTIFSMTFH